MKTTKILAALCTSAMVISAMAAQVSADETKAAETTAAAADESTTPAYVFSKGVWLLTSESGAGTYYIFDDATSGHTERADGTGGVPFSCEQDGWNITFHFGGPDDTTKAAVSEGDASVTFTYEDGTTKTYSVEYIDGADPDTFSADEYENTTTHVFSKGVWLFSDDDTTGTYFIFDDETSGHTERADNTGGVPFSCEQDGWNITFHFGGPDDTTKAAVSEGDAIVTFTYEDGTTKTYSVEYIDGADPDTFSIDAFIDGNVISEEIGDVDAATDSDKGSPDTGIADVAAAAGLGILAAGAFIAAKKRK